MSAAANSFGNGAAQATGNQVANAVLNTPQGQAVVAATAAAAVALAPIAALGVLGTGTVLGAVALFDWAKRNW